VAIAIISHAGDDHAAAVTRALSARGRTPILIDTAAFPTRARLSCSLAGDARALSLCVEGETVDLDALNVIWWRRPQPYALDPNIDGEVASFVYNECHEALSGAWHSLRARWVNPPAADEVAHHKPLQLALASELGLKIPATLITNDPAAARAFIEERGPEQTVYKTFLAHDGHWRETRVLAGDELALLDCVRLAPVIFQEFIPSSADLRVTVFDQDVRAVEIVTAPGEYPYDYRVALDAVTMRATRLPRPVKTLLLRLMKRLGLLYGAIDLRRTPSGEYVFLEVNPAGEFLFVQERSGEDLTAAMADLLWRLDIDSSAISP